MGGLDVFAWMSSVAYIHCYAFGHLLFHASEVTFHVSSTIFYFFCGFLFCMGEVGVRLKGRWIFLKTHTQQPTPPKLGLFLFQGSFCGRGRGCFLWTHVARFSAFMLDIRICELLLLRMDNCVPPFTPLLAREGWRCLKSTAKYRLTFQLLHFLFISDCTLREKL